MVNSVYILITSCKGGAKPCIRILRSIKTIIIFFHYSRSYSSQLGDLGSGAGKGGGGGGSIRDAGGAFGKREAGKEEEYFYKQVVIM
jgi:hypothetical protein